MNRAFGLKFIFILLGVIFVSAEKIDAQLDPTFGSGGITTTNISFNDAPLEAFVLPDSKILVVASSNAGTGFHFLRYNADGTPDSGYGTGGRVTLALPFVSNPAINKILRQSDGKIILLGRDNNNGIIIRLNENGSLDTSFASGGIHRPNINQLGLDEITSGVIQPDGKILVGGTASSEIYFLRYLSNGALDDTFGNEGYITYNRASVDQDGANIFLLPDGRFVNIGNSLVHTVGFSFKRYNSNGTIDNSYQQSYFTVNNSDQKAQMLADGKFLITRYVSKTDSLNRTHTDTVVTRLNADASPDSSFGIGGTTTFDVTNAFNDFLLDTEVLPSGEILVVARTDVTPNRSALRGPMLSLTKLSANGAVTGKFLVFNSFGYNTFLTPQPDGKILIFTSFGANNNFDIQIARVTGVPLQIYRLHGVPFDFNITAPDGFSDPSVFRPGDRKWYINNTYPGFTFGLADDVLAASDYIGDFGTDLAVFRPSNGTWYIAREYQNASTNYMAVQWGQNGDIPAPADYDGDGKSDLTVFRPSNGTWYIRNSADNSVRYVQWGLNGDKPTPGDFDGDGIYDIAVFRPSEGNWYIIRSSDGQTNGIHFGLNGDVPVQEDYDGDGKTDIAVQRPSDGVWYRLNSSDGSFYALQWGIPADIAVPADYDGDGKIDIAVWRSTNGRWYVYQSSTNSMFIFTWGTGTDIPLQRKF